MDPPTEAPTTETLTPIAAAPPERGPRRRRRLLALLALVAVAVAVALEITNPFHGGAAAPGGVADNQYPTSIETVTRQSLTQQTQVTATLGFAGDSTIRLPAGTPQSAVTQAQQQVTADQGMLANANSSLSSDQAALAQAQATLSADQQQETIDCAGDNAAQAAAGAAGGSGTSSGCASAAQLVLSDQQSVTADTAKVAVDQSSVTSAGQALADAEAALHAARAQEVFYGQNATFTDLPSGGAVIRRGQRLFGIDRQPVLLLYGGLVATRAFALGMSPGPDVGELNSNLAALGYGQGLTGDAFTSATAAAISALQVAHGLSATGELLLGSVLFESGPVRVTAVMPNIGIGSGVMPGPVLTVSTTGRQVTIQLDAALQGQVKVGDPVSITLPDNQTTPGRVSYVSSVASSGQGGSTIQVDAVPTDPAATGNLDQAPVNVAITTGSVNDALVVPVDALLALARGGYAVEEVTPAGVHHLVAVTTGLFDDADGLVAVSGSGLAAGQRVVVPGD